VPAHGVPFLVLLTGPLWYKTAKEWASTQKAEVIDAICGKSGRYKILTSPRPDRLETFKEERDAWRKENEAWDVEERCVDPKYVAQVMVCYLMRGRTRQGVFARTGEDYYLSKPPRENVNPAKEAWVWTYIWMYLNYMHRAHQPEGRVSGAHAVS